MAPINTGDFTEGDDRPNPVACVIAFGFYDGAIDGALETRGGAAYRFDFLDDWPGVTGDSVRMFLLRPLPAGSVARLTELISPHCEPRTPFWVPSWWHLDVEAKDSLDAAVDAVLDSAGPPRWAVAGWFLCGQTLRVRRAFGAGSDGAAWAARFGWA
ncbi:MAG: hypothetical protein K2V38_20820 [Gemmataceae bacterium]|nr:hypothetical protein [Gemmataceae bacterium]